MKWQPVLWLALAGCCGILADSRAAAQRILTPESLDRPAVCCLAFSPRGDSLLAGDAQGGVTRWEVARPGGSETLGSHRGPVYGVAFSPDGRTAASAGEDGTVRVWDVARRKEPVTMGGYRGRVYSVAFSPRGDALAAAGGVFATVGEIKLWDVAGWSETTAFQGQEHWVRCLAFSPDGTTLAAGGGRLIRLGEVRLWKPADPKNPVTLPALRDEVLALGFSPDSKTVAVAGRDPTVRLFHAADGKPGLVLRGHSAEVVFVAYASPGVLVSAGYDNTVRFWDANDGRRLGLLYDPLGQRRDGEVFAVALSADGKQLAIGSLRGQIEVWETEPLVHGRTPLYPTYRTLPGSDPVRVFPLPPLPR